MADFDVTFEDAAYSWLEFVTEIAWWADEHAGTDALVQINWGVMQIETLPEYIREHLTVESGWIAYLAAKLGDERCIGTVSPDPHNTREHAEELALMALDNCRQCLFDVLGMEFLSNN